MGGARTIHQLRRLPRHVRGPEQISNGPADLDEPFVLAIVCLADLRLLLRADGRLLRGKERVRAIAYPVEPHHGEHRGSQLQRWKCAGPYRPCSDTEHG